MEEKPTVIYQNNFSGCIIKPKMSEKIRILEEMQKEKYFEELKDIEIVETNENYQGDQKTKKWNKKSIEEHFLDPHICIIHPFVSYYHFEAIRDHYSEKFTPFTLEFDKFSYYSHGKTYSIIMIPKNTQEIIDIRNKMKKDLNIKHLVSQSKYKKKLGYTPHLTIFSQVLKNIPKEKVKELIALNNKKMKKPIKFKVNCIHLTSRIYQKSRKTRFIIPFKDSKKDLVKEIQMEKKLSKKCQNLVFMKFPFWSFGLTESDIFQITKDFAVSQVYIEKDENFKDKGFAVLKMANLKEKYRIINHCNKHGLFATYGKKFNLYVRSFY